MKWSCPKCKFSWTGNMETFHRVSTHEKSHKIKNSRRHGSTAKKIAENKKSQRIRIRAQKAARRSGKAKESKVTKSRSKRDIMISQKRTATVKKSRR